MPSVSVKNSDGFDPFDCCRHEREGAYPVDRPEQPDRRPAWFEDRKSVV